MEYKRIQKYLWSSSFRWAGREDNQCLWATSSGHSESFFLKDHGLLGLTRYLQGYKLAQKLHSWVQQRINTGGKKRESVNIQKFSTGEPDFDAVWTWDRHNNCVLQIAGCLLKSNLGSHPHHMRLMVSNDPPERARILRVTPALTQHTQTGESVKLHQTIVLEQQLPLDTAVPSKGHYSDLSL